MGRPELHGKFKMGTDEDLYSGRISSPFCTWNCGHWIPCSTLRAVLQLFSVFLPLQVCSDDASQIPLLICCWQLLIGLVIVTFHVIVSDVHHRTLIYQHWYSFATCLPTQQVWCRFVSDDLWNAVVCFKPPSLLIGKVWVPSCYVLIWVSRTLQSELESGKEARNVSIDFSAVFDLVNHQVIFYNFQGTFYMFCVVYIDTVSITACYNRLLSE